MGNNGKQVIIKIDEPTAERIIMSSFYGFLIFCLGMCAGFAIFALIHFGLRFN